jgi:Alginate lyase
VADYCAAAYIALKFKSASFALDANVVSWLHTMNSENRSFWEHANNRGNLRILGASAAALGAVIDRDPASLEFRDKVWHEAMAAIHDDGTIDAELARAQRALIYHGNSFSATLILRAARETLGYHETPQDYARLTLLANMMGHTHCHPHDIENKAEAAQEMPGDWFYRVPVALGPIC